MRIKSEEDREIGHFINYKRQNYVKMTNNSFNKPNARLSRLTPKTKRKKKGTDTFNFVGR